MPSNSAPYEKVIFYQQICAIRRTIHNLTSEFPKGNYKLVAQMKDAARSAKQNIREGYKKDSVGQFINSINISRGSLEELSGDVEDCLEDNLITEEKCEELKKLIKSVDYLSSRYIDSLYKLDKEGRWKKFKRK